MIKARRLPLLRPTAATLTASLLMLVSAQAAVKSFRYYRFTVTKVRGGTTAVNTQFSELSLKLAGVNKVTPTTTITGVPTGTSPESVTSLRDGSLTTKYYSATKPVVTIDFGTTTDIDSYALGTANDFDARDPVSWTLEGSPDNTAWTKLDIVNDAPVTTTRFAYTPDFIIPVALPPTVATFKNTASVVLNGQTTGFTWTIADGVPDSLTLNPGATNVTGTTSISGITPATNADTTYSLTAANTTGTSTLTNTVRAVAGGSRSFQYLRFTPLAVSSGTAVQVADIRFYGTDVVGGTPTSVERVPIAVRQTVSATNGSFTETATEGPNKLRDGLSSTKWFYSNYATVAVTFDLGSVQSFDKYSLTTANDSPERTPIRWKIEGSNDLTTWSRVEDLSTFNVTMPTTTFTVASFPFPGASLPPIASTFTANAAKVVAGEPVTLTWATTDAATVTITPDVGTVAASGTTTFNPATGGVYTLSAVSPAGFTVTKTVNIAVVPTAPALPDYPNFDAENGVLSLTGVSSILNDFANIPSPSNSKRLRLTPDSTGRNGGAWFPKRLDFSQGFDTTFSFMLTRASLPAADGFSFVIQNDADGSGATGNGENGTTNQSFAIGLDTYYNTDALPADGSSANLKVFEGASTNPTTRTAKVSINLATVPGVTGINGTGTAASLTVPPATATPHTVRAVLKSGKLNVWFDGIQVVTDLSISLSSSLNGSSKGWVGFVGRTGGYSVVDDITSWSLVNAGSASLGAWLKTNNLAFTTGGDADSDGLSDVLEYAFGLNPNASDNTATVVDIPGANLTTRGTPAVYSQSTPNGQDFRVVFERRTDSSGLVYTPEFSSDMVTWQPSTTTPTVIDNDGDVEAVTIPYPFFVNGKKARFFRVSVTTP